MKQLLLGSLAFLLGLGSVSATTVDNQIFDQLENDQLTADDLRFNTFQSCNEMETVLTDYVKYNFERNNFRRGGIGFPQPVLFEDVEEGLILQDLFGDDSSADFAVTTTTSMLADGSPIPAPIAIQESAKASLPLTGGGSGDVGGAGNLSSTNDFSTTNTQVIGIDEADILKSDGDYLYYYNQKEQKVQIIKTPLNIEDRTIDLTRLDVITEINLPDTFNGIQLYRQADNLVIISNRRRNNYQGGFLNNGNQVDVIVYNIANPNKPALVRFTELDGYHTDSRLIGDKLYVINELYMDFYRPMRNAGQLDDINLSDVELAPKNIDIAYTKNDDKKNLTVGDQTFPYHISVNKADCENIYYVLPSKDSIEQFGLNPSFTTVNVIDLSDTENTPDITTAFGNTNTIHMAKDNIYLTQNFWIPGESWNCPPNAGCIRPRFVGNQAHTLIHKMNVANTGVVYQDSTLVNGSPLTQYSMDQGPEGNFRILTSTRNPERATHLFVLDEDLKAIGSVENIEPGEEFKSSRYIGDKLYLVTFEQTDPLFVIDMVQPNDPKIIGELVIPGFSTYLHPYGPVQNNVQYLLGLGRDTDLNERGGTIQEGIKLDLYKIDYNGRTEDNHVLVTQEYSEVRGAQGSQSEAMYNPRMFVWDAENKLLVIPMQLMSEEQGNEICESERDPEGNIIWEECRNDGQQVTDFIGMKAIRVTPEGGIVETASFDYTHLYKQDRDIYNNGRYNTRQLMPRVGYVGDVLYQVNGAFGHFIDTANGSQQAFIELGDTNIDFNPLNDGGTQNTAYNEDAKGTAVCLAEMGWTLYTSSTDDCRYCETQLEVFYESGPRINYLEGVGSIIDCDGSQLECSDAGITGYPTWVSPEGERFPGTRELDELYELANCG